MKRGAVLFGVALGLGAILLGWGSRAAHVPVATRIGPRPLASAPPDPAIAARAATPAAAGAPQERGARRKHSLALPVAGVAPDRLRDSFAEPRTGHRHEAIDIPATRGTRVLAADDGTIARLLTSVRGGRTLYQLDADALYCYYYAHLDGYALGLREGQAIRRGDTLGFVGSTGNARRRAPHLHFAVYRLGPEKRCEAGTAVDPYLLLSPRLADPEAATAAGVPTPAEGAVAPASR